jgi:hypothetical protein
MSRYRDLQICLGLALILASPAFLPVNTQAQAATQDPKNDVKDITKVVAHIPLQGSAVRQIFYQEENGKRYLYLQQNVHFTVVDVTDPEKPQIVDRVKSGGRLTDVGAGLAIAVSSDQSGEGTVPTQTVKLMDMSDPKNPRTVKTFTGVTSMFSEDGRHLIFVTNSEGLWIVKHSVTHRLPFCTSESEENSVAQCR